MYWDDWLALFRCSSLRVCLFRPVIDRPPHFLRNNGLDPFQVYVLDVQWFATLHTSDWVWKIVAPIIVLLRLFSRLTRQWMNDRSRRPSFVKMRDNENVMPRYTHVVNSELGLLGGWWVLMKSMPPAKYSFCTHPGFCLFHYAPYVVATGLW